MSLAAAAQALGVPEVLVQRSAAARAAETGMSVDEILAAWAGGEVIESAPAPAAEESQAEAPQEETAAPEPEAAPPPSVIVDQTPATEQVAAASRVAPSEVTTAEAAQLPEVVTVPTAGIRERTNFRLPRWLFGVMLIIPAFALFTLGGSATGTCGEATELGVDVITGEIVNCDGSEFTGSGVGGGSVDFIALGEAVYSGSAVGGVNCSGCHGANGGGGSGPALNGVLTTFGRCADHEEWVRLGSNGFQAAGETTYGDTNKPVGGAGIMPAHASLTDEQLASVSAFERVRFGGGNPDEVLADCGLTEEEGAGGGDDGSGTTVPGEEGPGTTVPGEEGPGTTVPGEDGSGTTVG
jgi:mono/diheme cytochrome c family protein